VLGVVLGQRDGDLITAAAETADELVDAAFDGLSARPPR
jgi:hypothetical protein